MRPGAWRARLALAAPVLAMLLLLARPAAAVDGVTGYLPLNLEPRLEADVERLLTLAGVPIVRRPIPLSTITRAMPAGCAADETLCMQVQRELAPWLGRAALGMASFEAAIAEVAQLTQPNERGAPADAKWQVAAQAYAQVGKYAAVHGGAVAYRGRTNPSGSYVSVGNGRAQLDIGFRDRWWSPLRDSAWLQSTEAPTVLSATLSNSQPFTRLKLQYEIFGGRLSDARIVSNGRLITGNPYLAGMHASLQPVAGWSISGSRLIQFGGGDRPASWSRLLTSLTSPVGGEGIGSEEEFGNQQVAIATSFVVPGPTSASFYAEYAAEDTFHSEAFRFGNSALSFGLFFPKIATNVSMRYEFSGWEDVFYTHHRYRDGMTNLGQVLGHWAADWRKFGDIVGGQSHMLQLDWQRESGAVYGLRFRTAQNASYTGGNYSRAHLLSLTASAPWRRYELATGLDLGRDMYGKAYGRLAMTLYLSGDSRNSPPLVDGAGDFASQQAASVMAAAQPRVERFIELGLTAGKLRYEEDIRTVPTRDTQERSVHLAAGVRRSVSARNDLGARLEIERLAGYTMYAVRALDYRYRTAGRLAYTGFFGFARYEAKTPAHGYVGGAGVQLREVRPGWDLNLEARYYDRIVRKKITPGERIFIWPNEFYSMLGATVSLSRRF